MSQAETVPKLVAFTFDDGPQNAKTTLVLDKLKAHGIPASFFVIGQLVNDGTRPVLQRMVAEGHEIHNHSWAWDSMSSMTPEQISSSVDRTSRAIEEFAGVSPVFFRAPNLATSQTMRQTINMPFANGITARDWAGENTTAQERADLILRQVRPGAIILLHDVQPDPHPTPEALDIIIPALKEQGYQFVTLTELFRLKGVSPEPGKDYRILN